MEQRLMCVRGALALIVALGLTLVGAPSPTQAAQCREHQIRLDGEVLSRLDGNPTDTELLHAVAWLISHKLDLPLPVPVRSYMCNGEAAILDEMSRLEGLSPAWFAESVARAAGVTTGTGIFLREDFLRRMTRAERAGTIAHELAHVSQRTLAGAWRDSTPVWILEGHAQWVAFQVLEIFGYQTYGESRIETLHRVIDSEKQGTRIPDLRTVLTYHWQNGSWVVTYGPAFLAVDWLVERYGSVKLVNFLRSRGTDPKEQWGRIFPISYDSFVDEFGIHLKRIGS